MSRCNEDDITGILGSKRDSKRNKKDRKSKDKPTEEENNSNPNSEDSSGLVTINKGNLNVSFALDQDSLESGEFPSLGRN